jgi:hypothetical protein
VLTKLGVTSQLEAVALYRNATGRWSDTTR